MTFRLRNTRLVFLFLVIFLATIYNQHNVEAQSIMCVTAEQKLACQAAYDKAVAEQKEAERDLLAAKAKSSSLTNDIAILDAKIRAAELKIKAKNLLILSLGNDIVQKQDHINALEARIEQGRETLADLLRRINEVDQYELYYIMLSEESVSGFLNDVDMFQSVQKGLKRTFDQLKSDQASTTIEKNNLDTRRNQEIDARYDIQQQQKDIQVDQKLKQQLLSISKVDEKSYSALAAQKATQAAQIRAALFPLAGGGQAIKFEQALQYATLASQKTGVRPAFLLAIIQNESALGANVGQCYLTDTRTGNGTNAKTGSFSSNVMAPGSPFSKRNDVEKFMSITKSLGLDPFKTVVSCQQVSVGGWGGAMGPAQFIATTWVLFEARLRTNLNITETPNPWNPAHAFMASALFLSDLGAGNGGYTAERNAACRYFSGSYCSKSREIAKYGDSALAEATRQQQKINQL